MTGRYPWAVGYYDMQGAEAVPLNYTMLPAVLAQKGWSTHAIGKWNLGNTVRRYTPTFRGFSTFFGYYAAALGDYWYHGDPAKCPAVENATKSFFTDLSNSSGAGIAEGVLPADAPGVNGTYDQELFTAEAVRLIETYGGVGNNPRGATPQNLYIYLAYQNVHTTAQNKETVSGAQPLHAPCKTVDELYADTASDTHKVMGAMVTELDYGIGNVTAALDASRRDWVMILVSDNGGPINIASANAPLRGGKHTMWDGGLKVGASSA
jgi:arylsulfatase A-like enzyme